MKTQFFTYRLLETTSALALSAAAIIGSSALQPAAAQQGIYGGGSTLLSLTARQIFDCYHGSNLSGDGYTTTSPLAPGYLPSTCTSGGATTITGLYAGVGSGSGQRGFTANDPHQLVQSGLPTSAPTPAVPPVYVDGSNASPFGIYPYPELDFGASNSPLPGTLAGLTTVSFSSFTPTTSWQTVSTVSAASSTTVTYAPATFGAPIQLPAAEVPVAIAINTATTTAANWTIRSALSPNTQAGGAIQLSAAQLCAIFSGQVRDWSSAASIVNLVTSGSTTSQSTQAFDADNTNSTTHAGVAYTSSSLPIVVAYRSDGSGTSFIITNYLANVCPLLNTTSNHYTAIFTGVGATYPSSIETITVAGSTVTVTKTSSSASNLPNTSFTNLIANIKAVTGTDVSTNWVGASGTGNVALAVNTNSANSGRIGYVSNDFTKAYSISTNTTAPLSASIQDEYLRSHGVNHPGDLGTLGSAQNFVTPTPANANSAWAGLTAPAATATYNDWNVYNQNFASGTYTGKGILPLYNGQNAYPLTGTTFLELYSCYNDPTGNRVPAITNFVSWLIAGADLSTYGNTGKPNTSTAASPLGDPDVAAILQNNGFNPLPALFADAILSEYVTPGSGNNTAIADVATGTEGCTNVTGGAN